MNTMSRTGMRIQRGVRWAYLNQALRIPCEFELPGKEVIVRKQGDRLIVEPVQLDSLLALLATWEPLAEDFPDLEDRLPEPVDL